MGTWLRRGYRGLMLACALGCLVPSGQVVHGADAGAVNRAAIVMEKATLRGKIAILEARRGRKVPRHGLKIRVWQKADESAERRLVHETVTDEAGLFSLPLLEVGQYELAVEDFVLQLVVISQAEDRKGQEEPKILLIVVPTESLRLKKRSPQPEE